MNNISIISINTIKPLTPTPIPQEARDSDLATNINLNIGGNISITETEERHEYQKTHDTWGGDIGMAALGGAMTGLAGGLGMGAGNFIGGSLTGLAMSGASAFGSSNVGAVISENRKGTSNGTYTTNQIGSDIVALNNINITTNNNLNIAGSDLTSGNDTTLTSNNGSVNILAAIEIQTTEESKTKTNWKGIDFTHTNSSVGVSASVERNTKSNTTTTQYAKSSNIQSGNNIAINSSNNNISSTPLSTSSTSPLTNEGKESNNTNKQNINIIGSNIIAENDIKLNADNGDINVVSQELLQDVLDRQKTETITASVGISNTFAKTAMDIADGINQHNGYNNNAEGYASLATNLVFDGLNNLLTLGTLGFGVSADISYTNTETNTSQNNTYNQSSNIISNKGNIDLTAENDINIKGSTIATNGENKEINLTSNNGDINITASKDTINMNSNTDSDTVSLGGGVGLTGPTGLYAGYDKSKSDTNAYGTSYNNSVISNTNGTINIKTENTTNKENNGNVLISGANIEGKDINIDVANNLTVESLQDTYYSKTETNSYGGTVGTSWGSLSANYSDGFDKTDSKWVNNQTSIIGNNSVNINTNNNTDIKGAVIASGSYDENGNFIDNNNLSLNTKELDYKDINDFHIEETKGGGFSTSLGTDPDKGKANIAPSGSTTISMKNTGSEKEQITRATIGNGNITIGGQTQSEDSTLLTGLNRDVNNGQKITKDLITGALDESVTIDNRILLGFIEQNVYERDENGKIIRDKDGKAIVKTDANGNPITTNGYQSIYSDVKNFGTNTAGALVGATGTIINTAKITYDTIADEKSSITDIGNNWKTGQDSLATAIIRGGDDTVKEIMDKINKGEATPEELQYIASRTSKDKDGNLVFTSNGKSIIVEDSDGRVGEQLGFNDKITGQGYIDAGKTATDNKIFYTTDAEERIHKTIESETVAKNMADREVDYYNAMAFLTGGKGIASSNTPNSNNGGLNSQMQSNWNEKYNTNTNQLLNQNTILANNVKSEDKLYSTHFDKNGKAEFINDGDYNAYRKNDDGTLNYENQITYAEGFNLNIADDKKEAFEDQMKTNEVQMDLLRLLLMDSNKSITENTKDLNSLETQYLLGLKTPDGTYYYSWNKFLDKDGTRSKTNEALSNGADDFSLNYLYTNDIWKTIADNSSGISYPTQKTMGAFDIKIDESRTIINPAVGQEVRTKENGTCRTPGCGEKGSLRPGHTHQGTDILLNEGDYVIAPMDGKLYYTTSSKDKTKALNSLAVANDDIRILMLYVDKKSNIKIKKNGTDVEKGGIIGKGTSNSEFIRVYGKDTAQHTHVEQQNANDRLDKKDIQGVLFPNQQRELKK